MTKINAHHIETSFARHGAALEGLLDGLTLLPGEGRRVGAVIRSFSRRHGVNVQPGRRARLDRYDAMIWSSEGGLFGSRAWEVAAMTQCDREELKGFAVVSNGEHAYTVLSLVEACPYGLGEALVQAIGRRMALDADLRLCEELLRRGGRRFVDETFLEFPQLETGVCTPRYLQQQELARIREDDLPDVEQVASPLLLDHLRDMVRARAEFEAGISSCSSGPAPAD